MIAWALDCSPSRQAEVEATTPLCCATCQAKLPPAVSLGYPSWPAECRALDKPRPIFQLLRSGKECVERFRFCASGDPWPVISHFHLNSFSTAAPTGRCARFLRSNLNRVATKFINTCLNLWVRMNGQSKICVGSDVACVACRQVGAALSTSPKILATDKSSRRVHSVRLRAWQDPECH